MREPRRTPGSAVRPAGEPAIQSLSYIEIAYCCVVIVLAYAARGSTGFGAAAAMPLLGLVIPLKILIPAWTLIGLSAGVTLLGRDRNNIAWRDMAALLPTCLLGIGVGLYVFKSLDASTLARAFGGAVLAYGLYSLWMTFRPRMTWRVPGKTAAAVAGLLGGAVGTTFGTMASLFFAIYFDAIRMPKDHFRATMSAVLVALGIVRGLGYFAVDEFNRDVLITFALAVPMMLIGIFIGDRFHSGLSELAFRRVVSGALIASGAALLIK
jgi:uncharacterized protein